MAYSKPIRQVNRRRRKNRNTKQRGVGRAKS